MCLRVLCALCVEAAEAVYVCHKRMSKYVYSSGGERVSVCHWCVYDFYCAHIAVVKREGAAEEARVCVKVQIGQMRVCMWREGGG